jgi:hypothetical protein
MADAAEQGTLPPGPASPMSSPLGQKKACRDEHMNSSHIHGWPLHVRAVDLNYATR